MLLTIECSPFRLCYGQSAGLSGFIRPNPLGLGLEIGLDLLLGSSKPLCISSGDQSNPHPTSMPPQSKCPQSKLLLHGYPLGRCLLLNELKFLPLHPCENAWLYMQNVPPFGCHQFFFLVSIN